MRAQAAGHPQGHDYVKGSPHLNHPELRSAIERRLQALVADSLQRKGSCRALEIGAGHGSFSDVLVRAGATVTLTETSQASFRELTARFGEDPRVRVVYDATGDSVLEDGETWDLVALISLIHHIPDYLGFLGALRHKVAEGGALFSAQDPLYYPRRTRGSHVASRGSYFLWRLGQGNYRRGLATRLRRLRGRYEETEDSDLVEYHVVRQGCDEEAIRDLLAEEFDVELFTYWSTQSAILHRLWQRSSLRSDFGIEATHHRAASGGA